MAEPSKDERSGVMTPERAQIIADLFQAAHPRAATVRGQFPGDAGRGLAWLSMRCRMSRHSGPHGRWPARRPWSCWERGDGGRD